MKRIALPPIDRRAFSRDNLLTALSFGAISGLLLVFVQSSMATLIFNGRLEAFTGPGIGVFLFGTLVIGVIVGLTTNTVPLIANVQDAPVAILSVITVAVADGMAGSSDEDVFATVLATMLTATVCTGVCFWLVGRFRLGRLVRFIPYPVGGGFLAGTGWLLVVGGIGVATEADFGPDLFAGDALIRWLPAVLFATCLVLALRRFTHFLVLPGLAVTAVVAFYATYIAANGSLADAEDEGWLLGPFPKGRLWQPVTDDAITSADWSVVATQAPGIAVIMVVAIVAMLLNASGLELITQTDIDFDRELRMAGVANVVAGAGASPPGFQAVGMTALARRLGVTNRLGGLLASSVIALTMIFGAGVLSSFPRAIAGGFLVFLGLSFLVDWLYETWGTMPLVDYLLMWFIVVVIASVGFLEGVGVGILVAALLFLVKYSRVDVVRNATTRAEYTSATVRADLYEQLLTERGDHLLIVTLQGHLFFGTAHRLMENIQTRMAVGGSKVEFIVLDFRLVSGMDSSSVFSFVRLKQTTDRTGVTVVLTGLAGALQAQLGADVIAGEHIGAVDATLAIGDESDDRWHVLATLDDGVAWCEDRIIDRFESVGLGDAPRSLFDIVSRALDSDGDDIDWLGRLDPTQQISATDDQAAFSGYLEQRAFEPGDTLVGYGVDATGLGVLTTGRAEYSTYDRGGSIVDRGTLEAGADLMAAAFYAAHRSDQSIVALTAGAMTVLSRAAIERMEADHPHIALVLHRTAAAQLGQRSARLVETTRTLQK